MNATYHAVKESMNKIDANLEARGTALLPSPYIASDSRKLYETLIEMIPMGSKVKAVYFSIANDPASLKEIDGTVTGSASISKSEPSFHVEHGGFTVLLPGSVLEISS
jgi:hypothetical protein